MRPTCIGPTEQEHVDEIMRGVQGAPEKTQVERFRTMPVWVGMAGTLIARQGFLLGKTNLRITVAKVIEFYVPNQTVLRCATRLAPATFADTGHLLC